MPTLKYPGRRRRFTSRYRYLTGTPITDYLGVREREVTFDKRCGRLSYYCTACGGVIPRGTEHLVDRNGLTTRLHLHCGEAI